MARFKQNQIVKVTHIETVIHDMFFAINRKAVVNKVAYLKEFGEDMVNVSFGHYKGGKFVRHGEPRWFYQSELEIIKNNINQDNETKYKNKEVNVQ